MIYGSKSMIFSHLADLKSENDMSQMISMLH